MPGPLVVAGFCRQRPPGVGGAATGEALPVGGRGRGGGCSAAGPSRRAPSLGGPGSGVAQRHRALTAPAADTGAAVLCGLFCTRTAVPQAVQNDACLATAFAPDADRGFAVGAEPTVSRRSLQRRLHQSDVQDRTHPQDHDPEQQQSPTRLRMTARVSSPTKENRYTAARKAMLATPPPGQAPVVARGEAVVAAAQTRVLRARDAGGGADQQRLDEPVQEDQRHPEPGILLDRPAGEQIPVADDRVEAGVGHPADDAEGQPVHQIVELGPAGSSTSGPTCRMASPTTAPERPATRTSTRSARPACCRRATAVGMAGPQSNSR